MPIPTSEILKCFNCDKRLSGECIQGNKRDPMGAFENTLNSQTMTHRSETITTTAKKALAKETFKLRLQVQRPYIYHQVKDEDKLATTCFLAKNNLHDLDRSLR